MNPSKTPAKPRQLKPIELVAIGLLMVGVRVISGQLADLLMQQAIIQSAQAVMVQG